MNIRNIPAKTFIFFIVLSIFWIGQSWAQTLPINSGPYQPTDESLKQYQYPEWFRNAKFGIWAHWGPQSVPRHGDWYARVMYQQGSSDNLYHVEHYGPPSRFGYKDIIPLWKAEKWDPEKLMALYKKAGAKYFVSMGSHHDNFFLWNSKIHRWNAVNMGPHKDIVGLWQQAAKKQGLPFGVSEHLAASYTWFQSSHGADTSGIFKGLPYDGNDPQYQDLYHTKADPKDKGWLSINPEWQKEWYNDIKELADTYHPDLLYSDSQLPFGNVGRSMLANFYNGNIAYNNGTPTAVYNCKEPSKGKWVQDLERGVQDSISPFPWQTDTSIGDWFYRNGQKYKTSTQILQMLVDIVSKNGNLLLNIVQTPEGEVEPDLLKTLDEIGKWTAANGDGIYGTRPWKVFGERPLNSEPLGAGKRKRFDENYKYSSEDIRFTTKDNALYAFCLEVPEKEYRIRALGRLSKLNDKKIASIKMMGCSEELKWKQEDDALIIVKPAQIPDWKVSGFKIIFN